MHELRNKTARRRIKLSKKIINRKFYVYFVFRTLIISKTICLNCYKKFQIIFTCHIVLTFSIFVFQGTFLIFAIEELSFAFPFNSIIFDETRHFTVSSLQFLWKNRNNLLHFYEFFHAVADFLVAAGWSQTPSLEAKEKRDQTLTIWLVRRRAKKRRKNISILLQK